MNQFARLLKKSKRFVCLGEGGIFYSQNRKLTILVYFFNYLSVVKLNLTHRLNLYYQ